MHAEHFTLGRRAVDLGTHEVIHGHDRIGLTPNEVALLRYLVQHGGQPISKDQLHVEVFGYAPRVVSRAADYAIHRLRRKLEDDPVNPAHLLTVAGVGFRLVLDTVHEASPGPTLRHNLPPALTSFVGRSADLEAVEGLLAERRLVTLFGPAGIGKTRLSLESGRRWLAAGRSEVCFCALADCTDRAGLCAAVAHALGAGADLGSRPHEALGRLLAGAGPLVLVFDNCEQVVEAAAALARHWLEAAPELRILASSRERLRCPGEAVYELRPLHEAGPELYVERALAARASFAREAGDPAIRRLVERLDGLPLAIELAAAGSSVLSPEQMLERLEPTGGLGPAPRGAPDRQASLGQAIGWSWDLLEPWEQAVMAQLSCFRGPFDVADAEAVVRLPPGPHTVVDAVQALRDKSLLAESPGHPTPHFVFLQTIRAFAEARCDDATTLWTRHAQWVADATAEAVERSLYDDPDARRVLTEAHANLRVARERLESGLAAPELLARVLIASRASWTRGAPALEYLQAIDRALAGGELPRALRLELHLARARLCQDQALPPELGTPSCAEAGRLAREEGRVELEARAHLAHASLLRRDHRFAESADAAARTVALLAPLEPTALHVLAAVQLGTLAIERQQLDQARAHLRRALALCSRTQATWLEPLVLVNQAVLHSWAGDQTRQAEVAQQALDRAQALGDRAHQRRALLMLGVAESDLGRLDDAAARCHAAIALSDADRAWSISCDASVVLAGIELARNRLEAMEQHVRRARALQAHVRAPWHVAYIDLWEALACWGRWGSLERAHALLCHGIDLTRGHMQGGELELNSKRLAVEVHLEADAADRVDAALAALAVEAAARNQPDLCEVIRTDRLHVALARARVVARRGDDPAPLLAEVERELDRAPSRVLGVRCSRVLLAAVLAELQR
ncbi:MAG: putative ATPase/DNA-binding winged helix-turn-helix (wHTH) protein [Myxococcota bacterium]|jgi:predicted ATPase/DNA-binding winged helix-turn-helix (wHTH) protein